MENKENNFDKNLKEIREMSLKLKEPLEEPITILYTGYEKKKIKYKGGYENGKYEGRGIIYDDYYEDIIYKGYFKNNKYNGFGNKYKYKKLEYEGFYEDGKMNGKGILYYNNSSQYILMEFLIRIIILKESYMIQMGINYMKEIL